MSIITHCPYIIYTYIYIQKVSFSQEAKSDVMTVGFWYLVLSSWSCHKYSTETPQYTWPVFTPSINQLCAFSQCCPLEGFFSLQKKS